MEKIFQIHVRTVTGIEPVLAQELKELGAASVEVKNRAVTCRGGLGLLYEANLFCRTAIRVLRPFAGFAASDEKALYRGIRQLPWAQWLTPEGTLLVDANVYSSFTTHSLFVAQLVKDAIVDQFREATGKRPSVDLQNPDLRIAVTLYQNEVQVFLDSSGDSLHKRGYRSKAGAAPLSEALAAGILKLSGWDGTAAVVDPMCGSGTFCIEAGLMACRIAPGLLRKEYAFQKWPDYDRHLFEKLRQKAKQAVRREIKAPIIGLEVDPKTVAIAMENVEKAGLGGIVRIERRDFFHWNHAPENAGTLVMNPPYDERLPVDNVADLYFRIGTHLKERFAGWKAFVLCGNLDAIKYFGLRSSRRHVLYNGALECRLLEFELHRDQRPVTRPKPALAKPNAAWEERARTLANRLRKNAKHFSKWSKRANTNCYRVYNWDIPELAFYVDIYGDKLHFAEIERNHDHSPLEHRQYIQLMIDTAAGELKVARENIYFKKRKPQKSREFQYAPHAETGVYHEVLEGGRRFLVNLADHLDVGLFLDHRNTRALVAKLAPGKDFLNLFAYTGSFTVYAAAAGAKTTTTVDTSRTYLEWARRNLAHNGISGPQHRFVREDTFEFLRQTPLRFDLCVVDPPTRSVNRSSGRVFDVQADHGELLTLIAARIRPGGRIFFSTNHRQFRFEERKLQNLPLKIQEITSQTTSDDFAKKPAHRCWLIEVG